MNSSSEGILTSPSSGRSSFSSFARASISCDSASTSSGGSLDRGGFSPPKSKASVSGFHFHAAVFPHCRSFTTTSALCVIITLLKFSLPGLTDPLCHLHPPATGIQDQRTSSLALVFMVLVLQKIRVPGHRQESLRGLVH